MEFSVYLNRRVFIMNQTFTYAYTENRFSTCSILIGFVPPITHIIFHVSFQHLFQSTKIICFSDSKTTVCFDQLSTRKIYRMMKQVLNPTERDGAVRMRVIPLMSVIPFSDVVLFSQLPLRRHAYLNILKS